MTSTNGIFSVIKCPYLQMGGEAGREISFPCQSASSSQNLPFPIQCLDPHPGFGSLLTWTLCRCYLLLVQTHMAQRSSEDCAGMSCQLPSLVPLLLYVFCTNKMYYCTWNIASINTIDLECYTSERKRLEREEGSEENGQARKSWSTPFPSPLLCLHIKGFVPVVLCRGEGAMGTSVHVAAM